MLPCIMHENAICLVCVIPFSIFFFRPASLGSEKKLLGCRGILANVQGGNWSPVQGYDSNRLAGLHSEYVKPDKLSPLMVQTIDK